MKKILLLLYFLSFAFGCDKDKKKEAPPSTAKISGQLAIDSYSVSDFGQKLLLPFAKNILPAGELKADKVIAFYIGKGGEIHPRNLAYAQTVTVDPQMNFEIEFSKSAEVDWTLLLINSAADSKASGVVGYISLSNENDSLIKMPVGKVKDGATINLGSVYQNGDEARGNIPLESTLEKFELDIEKLTEIARTDDVIRNVKNIYSNSNEDGSISYTPETTFQWQLSREQALNRETDPTTYGLPTYNVIVNVLDSALSFSDVCANSIKKLLEMVPPSTLTFPLGNETKVYSPLNSIKSTVVELDNTGEACTGEHLYIGSSGQANFNFHPLSGAKVPLPVLPGQWKFKVDGKEAASFDLAATSPIDENNIAKIYVPIVKFNVDANDVISSLETKIAIWNETLSEFETLTDTSLFESSVSQFGFLCDDSDGDSDMRVMDHGVGSGFGTSVNGVYKGTFTRTWNYSTENSKTKLVCSWRVSYSMGGAQYNFGL